MPHLGVDPVVAAAEVVTAWQTIASRNANPQDAVVVSVTQMDAGDTIRTFRDEVRDMVINRMEELVSAAARDPVPSMAAEDFAFMLNEKPG